MIKPQYFNITTPSEWVAHVEINRPEKMNAFSEAMWQEMAVIFTHLSADSHVRVILFSGAGPKGFSAGIDFTSLTAVMAPLSDPARAAIHHSVYIRDFQACVSTLEKCHKPVIILYHGISFGMAIDIGVAGDIRLCTEDTKFSVKEVDIGLAADLGTLSRLPKICGGTTSWVKEVCITARNFSSAEAIANGFVSKVVKDKTELIADGMKLAAMIASKSPVAVQGTKRLLDYGYGRTIDQSLEYTAIWQAAMLQTTDVPHAVDAAMRKKRPTFEKL